MKKKARKKSWLSKLRHKYRLIIYNDNTFEEVFYVRLTRLNVFIVGGIFIILLIMLNTFIIAYTPLREFIPGYPSSDMLREIQNNALYVNQLETEINLRDQYLGMLKKVIAGEVPDTFDLNSLKRSDTSKSYKNLVFAKSKEDSIMRVSVEQEDKFSLSIQPQNTDIDLKKRILFKPVSGMIVNKFDPAKKHYAIDIVAKPNEPVNAVLDGVVILSSYSMETGNMVVIQHKDNLISIYKHLQTIPKPFGSVVKSGDAIGIVGNSGEYSTGPHLHFELWLDRTPVDPSLYITF
jgi:murein DD-endopeptidase MepM/ murein hydrolase activator NlpD